MTNKSRAFVSFDIDHDDGAKKMLAGQAKLPDSPFEFKDNSVDKHLTGDWREKVKRRMDNVDVVIVLCGTATHYATGVADELTIAKEKRSLTSCWLHIQIKHAQNQHLRHHLTKFTNGRGRISNNSLTVTGKQCGHEGVRST